MDLPAVQETLSLTADERELSRAIALLTQHDFLEPLILAAIADGYQLTINPNLRTSAVHEGKSINCPTPEISFRSGRSAAEYAESLCHELIHYAITRAGRIFGTQLNPIADMAMRLCEEASVFAITSDLMYQAARGINMKDGVLRPELWEANLASSFYTAGAYEKNSGHRAQAIRAAFNCFYTMPIPEYRQDYQDYSLRNILKFGPMTLLDPHNFTNKFNPGDFLNFLPVPYRDVLRPCLMQMNSLDSDHLVLGFATAQKLETDFLRPRLAAFGTTPSNLKVSVRDASGEIFSWRVAENNLMEQKFAAQSRAPRPFALPSFTQVVPA